MPGLPVVRVQTGQHAQSIAILKIDQANSAGLRFHTRLQFVAVNNIFGENMAVVRQGINTYVKTVLHSSIISDPAPLGAWEGNNRYRSS